MAMPRAPRKYQTFDARLTALRLDVEALNADRLHVSSGATVRLAARGGVAPSCWLRPGDPQELKEWIGVSQAVVDMDPAVFATRKAKPARRKDPDPDDDGDDRSRALARQFLLGDATSVRKVQSVLQLDRFELDIPLWAYRRVEIDRGGVLEFGAGANLLVADELIIAEGGTIRSSGSLKITCTRLARS